MVPTPNSYSRRISSNNSTVAFLRRIPASSLQRVPREGTGFHAVGGPFEMIELGQFRVSKTKVLVHLGVGNTERYEAWLEHFRDLVRRGLLDPADGDNGWRTGTDQSGGGDLA